MRIFDWQTSPTHLNLWLVRFDPISYGDPQNDYLYKIELRLYSVNKQFEGKNIA